MPSQPFFGTYFGVKAGTEYDGKAYSGILSHKNAGKAFVDSFQEGGFLWESLQVCGKRCTVFGN